MITNSVTFCSAPWDSLNIDQTGRVSSCMHMADAIGNIKQTTLQQILSGPVLTDIKQAIGNGEWHSACRICKELELTTGASGRTVRACTDDTKQAIEQNINWFEPHHLVVNWSNLCNLTCVYCNPETSTAWQSVKKIPIDFVRNDQAALTEIMREKGHTLQGLTLGGGEPLLQKGLLEMLQYVDKQKVQVMVTTNLTADLEHNDIYQELKTWPDVSWMISFDNVTPEKFEYVRFGAKWSDFVKNIEIMQRDNQRIQAHPAYSIYCAFDLVEYYEFCEDRKLGIFWCDLSHPMHLDARRLPLQQRLEAIAEIDQVVERWNQPRNGLAIDTLLRYRQTLEDPSYLYPLDYYNPLKFHEDIEQELGIPTKFTELWPKLARNIK